MPFDMMPQTNEAEVLCLLRRAGEGSYPALARSESDSSERLLVLLRGRVSKPFNLRGGLRVRPVHRFNRSSLCVVDCASGGSVNAGLLLRLTAFCNHPVVGDAAADRATSKFFAAQRGLERPFVQPVACEPSSSNWFDLLAPDLALVVMAMRLEETP